MGKEIKEKEEKKEAKKKEGEAKAEGMCNIAFQK